VSRRVVTDQVEGRSRVLVDGPIARTAQWQEIWSTSPAAPLGTAATDPVASLDLPPGVTAWRLFEVPPDEEVRRRQAASPPAAGSAGAGTAPVGPDGFHLTRTVDYIYLLDGELTLELDDGAVELRAGDFVVQRATNHAWRNLSNRPARVLGVMIGISPPSP
jgi:mannose-6-phosphate isomerase-like protein (cupin superfamily)